MTHLDLNPINRPILDCTTSKLVENKFLEVEESYKQHIHGLELELKLQNELNEKKAHDIKKELVDDEELEGKGNGGKGYVTKMCSLKMNNFTSKSST